MKYVERAVIALFSAIALAATTWACLIGITHLFDANGWARMTASDWGTWVSAIGTIGTLIGTIWISQTSERDRRNAQRDAAIVAAGALDSRLLTCMDVLENVLRTLDRPIEDGYPPKYETLGILLSNSANWNADELIPLVPVPNHAAAHLAMAREHIRSAAKSLRLARLQRFDNNDMAEFHKGLNITLVGALMQVRSAWGECSNLLEINDVF